VLWFDRKVRNDCLERGYAEFWFQIKFHKHATSGVTRILEWGFRHAEIGFFPSFPSLSFLFKPLFLPFTPPFPAFYFSFPPSVLPPLSYLHYSPLIPSFSPKPFASPLMGSAGITPGKNLGIADARRLVSEHFGSKINSLIYLVSRLWTLVIQLNQLEWIFLKLEKREMMVIWRICTQFFEWPISLSAWFTVKMLGRLFKA
jgi:hypothetical protein